MPVAPRTVAPAVDGALVEDHDVLGERPRLVGEDVLYLTQLLVQRGSAGLRGRPLLRTEHLLVPVDEVAVAQANDLDTAQGTGGQAGREAEAVPPLPRGLRCRPSSWDRRGQSGHLGSGTWGGGKGEGSLKVARPHTASTGSPQPRPSDALQVGQVGQTAQVEEEETGTADKVLDHSLPQG